MHKRFRTCSLDQLYLLPPSLQDWLPARHLARFIADITEELDLSAMYAGHERKDGRGQAAYHPLMLTRVLLYAYCIGLTSSRRIEKATYEDVAIRYLAADQHPDHDTIAAFRQQQLERLAALFGQALRLCQRAGLVKLGNVALDGTKIQASASRERSMSHARLSEQEQQLQVLVERLLEQAEQTDREEDERYGKGLRGDELPPELADAKSRLKKIREAKRALEQEAAEQLERAQREHPEAGCPGRPRKDAPPAPVAACTAERGATEPSIQLHRSGFAGHARQRAGRLPSGVQRAGRGRRTRAGDCRGGCNAGGGGPGATASDV